MTKIYQCDDINQAYENILVDCLSRGTKVSARGLTFFELSPFLFVLNDPMNRLYSSKMRNYGIALGLLECFFILSASKDLKYLNWFTRELDSFSDDGKTLYGAYGPRIMPQLRMVIEKLKKDPGSRQAVISIYNGEKDLAVSSLDIPCLRGDTIIYSPEGDVSISELARKFSTGEISSYPVYSLNEEKGEVEFKWCRKAWKSGNKKLVRVVLDNGKYVDCTEDHVFYTKDYRGNVYKTLAKNLKPGNRCVPINFIKSKKGYLAFVRKIHDNFSYRNQCKVNREYYKFYNNIDFASDFVVHHKDENKINNSISNLELKEFSKHTSDHQLGGNNSIFNLKDKPSFYSRAGNSVKNWYKSADFEDKIRVPLASKDAIFSFAEDYLKVNRKISIRKFRNFLIKTNEYAPSIFRDINYYFGSFSSFRSIVQKNHKILKVEFLNESDDVYDMEVDDNHNFFIYPGILVHNCTLTLQFTIRDNKLNMIVSMRSNDLLRGFLNDTFIFTVIQEIVANTLGVPLGFYSHHVGSEHIYDTDTALVRRILRTDRLPYGHMDHAKPPVLGSFCLNDVSYVWKFIELFAECEGMTSCKLNRIESLWNDLPNYPDIRGLCAFFIIQYFISTRQVSCIGDEVFSCVRVLGDVYAENIIGILNRRFSGYGSRRFKNGY